MFIGGILIKRFDGLRRLCRQAAAEFHHPLSMPDGDLLLVNRTMAALGGPPAASEVRGSFQGDGLPLMLLFLLTQEIPCRVGLFGEPEAAMGRLKSLVHVFGHAVYPLISGKGQLPFQEVVKELGPSGATLRPLVQYDEQGEPTGIHLSGGSGVLRAGREGGPYTLAVLMGQSAGPAPLSSSGGSLHPTVLLLP